LKSSRQSDISLTRIDILDSGAGCIAAKPFQAESQLVVDDILCRRTLKLIQVKEQS
jgi:hypothetical protein